MDDELLQKIQSGDSEYHINSGLLAVSTFSLCVRSKVYLEHIIDELYAEEKERLKIVQALNEIVSKELYDRLTDLISMSGRDSWKQQ